MAAQPSFGDDTRFSPAPHLAHRVIGGEVVFSDVEAGHYFTTSGVGTCIWHLLCRGARFGDIVAAVVGRYPENPARMRRDVDAFVRTLVDNGLVVAEH